MGDMLFSIICAIAFGQTPATVKAALQRYDAAQGFALAVHDANSLVARAQWEPLFLPAPAVDALRALRAEHAAIIAAATSREQEGAASLDLPKVRAAGFVRDFCAQMPKGGMLHVHPFGTLSLPALQLALRIDNPRLNLSQLYDTLTDPAAEAFLYLDELAFVAALRDRFDDEARYLDLDIDERARLESLFFLTSGSHPFARFQASFSLMLHFLRLTSNPFAWDLMYDDALARAADNHVSYIEFSAPVDLSANALAKLDALAADALTRYGVTVRFLATFMRYSSPAELRTLSQQLLTANLPDTVVGINLVSDETNTPALERAQTLYLPVLAANRRGLSHLHRTMHAGELGDPRNPRDAMVLGAERLGHAVNLADDPVALEYARVHHVAVEANLTSNVRLGLVSTYAQHPYLHYARLGVAVSLSTDDEGVFGIDMNHECEVAIAYTDIRYQELRRMLENSLMTAFAQPDVAQTLRDRWASDMQEFETRWATRL